MNSCQQTGELYKNKPSISVFQVVTVSSPTCMRLSV